MKTIKISIALKLLKIMDAECEFIFVIRISLDLKKIQKRE